jgi:hypothetical protein
MLAWPHAEKIWQYKTCVCYIQNPLNQGFAVLINLATFKYLTEE